MKYHEYGEEKVIPAGTVAIFVSHEKVCGWGNSLDNGQMIYRFPTYNNLEFSMSPSNTKRCKKNQCEKCPERFSCWAEN
jgi:hypothetical protein